MRPLEGVQVVEAANYLAGPYAAMILADLGAEVTKVEPPRGDPYRRLGVPYGDSSLQFKGTNQTKRSVVLDLKSDDGLAAMMDLLAEADVLVSNWRPGVAEELGITPELVRDRFPRLVWARVSGYGQDGPRAGLPAFDAIIQARSGGLIAGESDPFETNNNIADKVTAMFAAQSVSAALLRRATTGEGAIVDLAMVDAMAYFYGTDASVGHRVVGSDPDTRIGNTLAARSNLRTADGWLILSPVSGKQVRAAMEAAGVGDRFGEVMEADRAQTFQVFMGIIEPALAAKPAAEWETIFADADVPAARIRNFAEHIADEQTVHNRTYRTVADPNLDGDWLLVRYPALYDGAPVERDDLPPPALPAGDASDG